MLKHMGRGQSATATLSPQERTTEVPRDWTFQAARAVHGLVDFAAEHPRSNPGPWTISFDRNGNARCRSSAYEPHQPAVMVCEPGWYRFIWGPHLNDLASHLWQVIAQDLEQIGVRVDVPSDEERKLMYWGPMPVEREQGEAVSGRGGWSEPRRTVQARKAREEYLERLRSEKPSNPEPFPLLFKQRRPLREEREANLKARTAAKAPAPAPKILPWSFGHWGKGFVSANGQMYAWRTSSPEDGGHPQHKEAQSLIEKKEGAEALEKGYALTNSDIAHFAPIVIAPNGQYAQDSADPFWQDDHLRDELLALINSFDPDQFSSLVPALRYVTDADKWADDNLSHGQSYSHIAQLVSV